MKKRIAALLLIAALGIPLFSCGGEAPAESSAVTDGGSSETEVSDDPSAKLKEEVLSMLPLSVDRGKLAKNIFKGLGYKMSREPSESYPDDGKSPKLTDGATSETFDKTHFIGWTGGVALALVFDLGEGERALADIEVHCLRVMDYGIGLPEYVDFAVSNDGKNYTSLARQYRPNDAADGAKTVYRAAFPGATGARYVKITCARQDNAFLFIDEVAGYEYSGGGTVDLSLSAVNLSEEYIYDLYGEAFGKADVTVSGSDADYDTVQNLMLIEGTAVTAQTFDALPVEFTGNTPAEELYILGDGIYPSVASYTDPNWAKFVRAGGRHVICDLGCEMAVSGYRTQFLEFVTAGVTSPRAWYVSLSSDGVDWVSVAGELNVNWNKNSGKVLNVKYDFPQEYKARYVRLTFQIDMMVYIGEIEVIGRKNAANAADPVEYGGFYGKYAYPDEAAGCDNILFAPVTDVCGNHMTEMHVITRDAARKYIVKEDENGSPAGILFDSIAISVRGETGAHANRDECFDFFFSELFDYEDLNLGALDGVMGEVRKELGVDQKLKIWISVVAPATTDVFNGKTTDTADKIFGCLKWQADEMIRRLGEKHYENLEFLGFYWAHEAMRFDIVGGKEDYNRYELDLEVAKRFNEYAHKLGLLTFWCPYYNANGAFRCREIGFDLTCMQPNYMFYDTTGQNRLSTTAELAKLYGMCVEIETESPFDSRDKYYEYLGAGIDTGYIDAVKVYYQGTMPGAYAAAHDSDADFVRKVYDVTVKYAEGTLTHDDLGGNMYSVAGFKDVTVTTGERKKTECSVGSLQNLRYRPCQTPLYGEFRVDADGTVYYRPVKNFKGEDKLVIELLGSDGVKRITVTFVVE
ncbi:MAG: DUF4855 domain-containing protein [Clostridia bacterium]|nr:DUF4855 domain-containing protein [Clostridia bacterium]